MKYPGLHLTLGYPQDIFNKIGGMKKFILGCNRKIVLATNGLISVLPDLG